MSTGDRPQEDLAKFGYRPDSKVELFLEPAIFWRHPRNYGLNLVNSAFFFSLKLWQLFAILGFAAPFFSSVTTW